MVRDQTNITFDFCSHSGAFDCLVMATHFAIEQMPNETVLLLINLLGRTIVITNVCVKVSLNWLKTNLSGLWKY